MRSGGGQHRALRFFGLTIALSWAMWVPLVLVRFGLLRIGIHLSLLVPLALPGVLMPSVAATILSHLEGGGGVRRLLARLMLWRVGATPWLLVVLMQPALLVTTTLIVNGLHLGDTVTVTRPAAISGLVVSLLFLLIASTGEEIGWRGYALPALQEECSALSSSLILGVVAATWHLPYWLLQGILAQYGIGYFALNYLFVVAITIQLTWIFNRSRSSILIPVVFHVVFNALNVALLPVTSNVSAFGVLTAIECLVALPMMLVMHRTNRAAYQGAAA